MVISEFLGFPRGSSVSTISFHKHSTLLNRLSSYHFIFSFIHSMSSFTSFRLGKLVWLVRGEAGRAPCAHPLDSEP